MTKAKTHDDKHDKKVDDAADKKAAAKVEDTADKADSADEPKVGKDAIDEKLEAGGEIEGQPAGFQQGQEKLYAPRVGDVQARETDPEVEGTGTAADGVHDVVESKETPRSAAPVSTANRRNLDDFTETYQGQLYVCIATKDGKEHIVGYTNDSTGGGMIELVDASPELKGPMVTKLTDDEQRSLTSKAYTAAR